MTKHISAEGRAFIEKWEECVLYVYDDKVPKRHIGGHLQYPEWDGGEVRGTLTIGYGHTDAAGYPKIKQGLRITKEQADEILGDDLAPCERDVERLVKVNLGQHQFDALVSFDFNCGAGNLRKLVTKLNQGDYEDIPRHLMNFVSSKGERMQGLVNRRTGEAAMWNKPDDPDEAAVNDVFSPKGDMNDPPKGMTTSKTGNSAVALAGGSSLVGISEMLGPVKETADNFKGLIETIADKPLVWVALLMVGLAAFVWWDRRNKLTRELV